MFQCLFIVYGRIYDFRFKHNLRFVVILGYLPTQDLFVIKKNPS